MAVVGAHVASDRPLETARALGADCVQIFLSDPQGWQKPDPREDAAELRESAVPVYVHAPYLINVCSPRNNVRYGSRKILQQTCEAAADVGAAAVIVHAGHAEDGVAEGVGRWVQSLELLESDVPVLIENTAGGDNAVAAASTPSRASGKRSPGSTPRSAWASASTPVTRTPPARSCPTPSSACSRSWGGSTCCT